MTSDESLARALGLPWDSVTALCHKAAHRSRPAEYAGNDVKNQGTGEGARGEDPDAPSERPAVFLALRRTGGPSCPSAEVINSPIHHPAHGGTAESRRAYETHLAISHKNIRIF